MLRRLSYLLPCFVLLLLAIALRPGPAAEPARAATLPAEQGATAGSRPDRGDGPRVDAANAGPEIEPPRQLRPPRRVATRC